MNDQVYSKLVRWIEQALKNSDNQTACMLYAHLAYLFLHTPYEEFNPAVVVSLLTAQIFLNGHYRFNSENDTGKKVRRTAKGVQTVGLGIPDTEIFDLFQKQRGNVLRFLMSNDDQRNGVHIFQPIDNIQKLWRPL